MSAELTLAVCGVVCKPVVRRASWRAGGTRRFMHAVKDNQQRRDPAGLHSKTEQTDVGVQLWAIGQMCLIAAERLHPDHSRSVPIAHACQPPVNASSDLTFASCLVSSRRVWKQQQQQRAYWRPTAGAASSRLDARATESPPDWTVLPCLLEPNPQMQTQVCMLSLQMALSPKSSSKELYKPPSQQNHESNPGIKQELWHKGCYCWCFQWPLPSFLNFSNTSFILACLFTSAIRKST